MFVQLRWENSESTDTATTSHLAALKYYVRKTQQHFMIDHLELLKHVRELHNLSGADKSPVHWIKQDNKISSGPGLQEM